MKTNFSAFTTLSGTPMPVGKFRFVSIREANAEICRLEDRNRELESMAAKSAVSKVAPSASAEQSATPAPDVINFSQWQEMSCDNQKSFCMNGGKISREAFLAMPNRAQEFFLSSGGHIAISAAPPDSPQTKNPPQNSLWRKTFFELSPKEQSAHFERGGKLHD